MKQLTTEIFDRWLEAYSEASQKNDARASAELFAQNAQYYETPFDKPMVGREAIYQYWHQGAQRLKDKGAAYEILAVKDNLGIARWRSKFTVMVSSKRLVLDCLFVVEFDDDEKCSLFREWWHIRQIDELMNGVEMEYENPRV